MVRIEPRAVYAGYIHIPVPNPRLKLYVQSTPPLVSPSYYICPGLRLQIARQYYSSKYHKRLHSMTTRMWCVFEAEVELGERV